MASDGAPDVNFGLNGWSYFPAFAVYMDSVLGYAYGKVVLVGTKYAGDGDFILTKLNMDGPPQFEIPKGITTKPGLQVPIDLGKRLQLGSTQFAAKDSASEPRSKNPLAVDNASTNRRPANSGLKVSDDVERERNIDAFFEELENSSRGLHHGISLNIAF